MQLPIDVKAVVEEATNIEGARLTPLSVSVYIDGTAPGDLIGHVRSAFASAGARVRVTISYLDDGDLAVFSGDDMAVLVAGLSERIGADAAALRAAGVPVMVATTLPNLVEAIAEAAGNPIPQGDIVFPGVVRGGMRSLLEEEEVAERLRQGVNRVANWAAGRISGEAPIGAAAGAEAAEGVAAGTEFAVGAEADVAIGSAARVEADATVASEAEEPLVLDSAAAELLDSRMGEWIIAACSDRRLAFALAFPFVRRPLSEDVVHATAAQNAGVGLVLFIPGADLPIMTLNQAKMLLRIAAAYGEPLGAERVKELAAVVGGAFACRSVARQAVALVPALGWAVKAAIGYAGTLAMGRAAIEYFEGGGNVSGLASVVACARDKAIAGASALHSCARAVGLR